MRIAIVLTILFAAVATAAPVSIARASDPRQALLQQAQVQQAQVTRAEREEHLRFCNKHTRQVQVAVAWLSGEKTRDGRQIVISKGWYNIRPGQCSTLVKGPLPYRYYYYYAQDASNAVWKGDYPVCVSEKSFTIKDTQCGSGYKRRGFRQIDTQGRKQLTLNLN